MPQPNCSDTCFCVTSSSDRCGSSWHAVFVYSSVTYLGLKMINWVLRGCNLKPTVTLRSDTMSENETHILTLLCCLNTLQTPSATAVIHNSGSLLTAVSQLPTHWLCHAPAPPPPIQLKQTKPDNDKFFTQRNEVTANAGSSVCVFCFLMSVNMQAHKVISLLLSWFHHGLLCIQSGGH